MQAVRGDKSRRWVKGIVWAMLLVLFAGIAASAVVERFGAAPRELARYLQRRASGHNAMIVRTGRVLADSLRAVDAFHLSPLPALPDWAGAHAERSELARGQRVIEVHDAPELLAAIHDARAGDLIHLQAGHYTIRQPNVEIDAPGEATAPIVVQADRFGEVVLELDTFEGFRVRAPYWRFENLVIKGTCAAADRCEHAFHVVGAAHDFVLRNSRVEDFDAPLKINGESGLFPDRGRIERNTLVNNLPRKTMAPVVGIDLVAASGWAIAHNLIADFVKLGGDGVSYAAYAKGGGRGNRFDANVVICEAKLVGEPGQRVGLSFGGGGTGPAYCRDQRCVLEQQESAMSNNLVSRCSDRGIYLNSSAATELKNNTVLNTSGVTVRFPESSARVEGNLIDGAISVRDQAIVHAQGNRLTPLWATYLGWHAVRSLFIDADRMDMRWRASPPRMTPATAVVAQTDLCGARPAHAAVFGAFEDIAACSLRR